MKKLFVFMTMFVAIALLTVSCKDEEKDPAEVAATLISGDWQGEVKGLKRNGSSWWPQDTHWVVIQFKASSVGSMSGNGRQLEFRNENVRREDKTDESSFTWRLDGSRIRIIYDNRDWHSIWIDFNDADLDANRFSGVMWDNEDSDYKFDFSLNKRSFGDWNAY